MVSNFMPLSLRQITSTKYNMICRIATLLALVFMIFCFVRIRFYGKYTKLKSKKSKQSPKVQIIIGFE